MGFEMKIDADILRELREDLALSMRELSNKSGVGHNTIYRIENGRTDAQPKTIRKLAEALGVSPRELQGRK